MDRNRRSNLRPFIRLLAVSLCAILLSSFFVIIFGHRKTSQLTLVSDDTYLQIFYSIFHRIGCGEQPDARDFVIFNVHYDSLSVTEERKKIAEILTDVAQQKPRLVVLDITMARRDSLSDRFIENALSLYGRDSVVVAAEKADDSLVQSFFNEDGRYLYGSANIPDFYDYTSNDGSSPRLVSLAASLLAGGSTCTDPREDESSIVIDYRDIDMVKISSLADMKANGFNSLTGKIVVIGDCDGPVDRIACPFYIGTERVVPGTKLNAIMIHSLYREGNHFHYVGNLCNYLICLLLTFIYSCLYFFLDIMERKTRNLKSGLRNLSYFIKPVFLLVGEVLLLLVSVILLTAWFGIFISPFLAMIAIIFVEPFFQFLNKQRADE